MSQIATPLGRDGLGIAQFPTNPLHKHGETTIGTSLGTDCSSGPNISISRSKRRRMMAARGCRQIKMEAHIAVEKKRRVRSTRARMR